MTMRAAPNPDLRLAPRQIIRQLRNAALEPVWTRDDGITNVWRIQRPGGNLFLKVDGGLAEESERLRWLHGRLPVPAVLDFAVGMDGRGWLLTEGLEGVMAADPVGEEPRRVIQVLGETLRTIHNLPSEGCPFASPAESGLEDTRRRLKEGVGWRCWHPAREDWVAAEDLLHELGRSAPDPAEPKLIHGDYCLPNVLLLGGRLTGILDLGHFGRGDPGFDIVSADGSGRRNLGADWDLDLFLAAYGDRPEPERLRWLALLRALVWA